MKNLIKLLPLIALFIGSTVALATTVKQDDPTLYNLENVGWQEIPEGYRVQCDEEEIPVCKASGTINFPIPDTSEHGYGTLVLMD